MLALLASSLAGCVRLHQTRLASGEVPTLIGPAVRDNRTPMDGALSCFGAELRAARGKPPVIAVGDLPEDGDEDPPVDIQTAYDRVDNDRH